MAVAPVPVVVRESPCGAALSNSRFEVAPGPAVFELRLALHGREPVTVDLDDGAALRLAVLIRSVYRRRNATEPRAAGGARADRSGNVTWRQRRNARAAR